MTYHTEIQLRVEIYAIGGSGLINLKVDERIMIDRLALLQTRLIPTLKPRAYGTPFFFTCRKFKAVLFLPITITLLLY